VLSVKGAASDRLWGLSGSRTMTGEGHWLASD
jgi:hypothetical protein